MSDGRQIEKCGIDSDGLDALERGCDPFSGDLLRTMKKGQIISFDIPLNDCKELDMLGTWFCDVQDAHRVAQRRGEQAVKSYLSTHLLARRQNNGNTRFMQAEQMMFVSAEHWKNSLGEPYMHTHLLLINMCLADGKWVAVDSRQLYRMYENIRSVYETTIYGNPRLRVDLASHGVTINLRGKIPQVVKNGNKYVMDPSCDGKDVKPMHLARDTDENTTKQCAMNAVKALSDKHDKWSRNELEVAVYNQIRDLDVTGIRKEIEALASNIMSKALILCSSSEKDPLPFMKCLTASN